MSIVDLSTLSYSLKFMGKRLRSGQFRIKWNQKALKESVSKFLARSITLVIDDGENIVYRQKVLWLSPRSKVHEELLLKYLFKTRW